MPTFRLFYRGVPLRRRDFMMRAAGLVTAVPLAARAQQGTKRLAVFDPSEASAALRPETEQRYFKAFFDQLRRLGYVEKQNLIVESYGREQNTSGPETLAANIVRGKPDLVYAVGPGAVLFKVLTTTIPIVTLTGDPIAMGMADSLSHPGRNFTGASIDTGPSIHGKRMSYCARSVLLYRSWAACFSAFRSMEWPVRRSEPTPNGLACRLLSLCWSLVQKKMTTDTPSTTF